MTTATWFLVTKEFWPAFRVFWRSLLQHNPRELFGDVIIQTDDIPDDPPEIDGTVTYRPLTIERYRGWPAFEPRVLACYGKLEALELLAYDQVLVLDCDMVCTGSIAEVFERPELFVGVGVECADNPRRRHNGGLWLARRPVIGNPQVWELFLRWAHEGKYFDDCDQSAMVVYLEHLGIDHPGVDHCLLQPRYNLQIGFAEYPDLRPIYNAERHDCRILHFTGPAKPWNTQPPAMGWRERFRPFWNFAAEGKKLSAEDVPEVQ